jgi:hypothetical protein
VGSQVIDQTGAVIGTVVDNPATVSKDVSVAQSWLKANTRTLEKLVLYGAGLVAATNGFAQLNLSTTVREWLLAGSAIVVASLHLSGGPGK